MVFNEMIIQSSIGKVKVIVSSPFFFCIRFSCKLRTNNFRDTFNRKSNHTCSQRVKGIKNTSSISNYIPIILRKHRFASMGNSRKIMKIDIFARGD
ncbi:unknown protein [Microcystis aeruginosa NIES-843]|uniref:Uncharacterized protein n=1 Tax=Microcystis aeruginosa (strain NIES-843 / IAM M-2473) TaxID=449447 RepID=B0JJF8_MICAN|nr:unknown protein [Microcystis aeruginosa NIES-843]